MIDTKNKIACIIMGPDSRGEKEIEGEIYLNSDVFYL